MNFDLVSSNSTYFDNFRKDSDGMMFVDKIHCHNVPNLKVLPISLKINPPLRMPSKVN